MSDSESDSVSSDVEMGEGETEEVDESLMEELEGIDEKIQECKHQITSDPSDYEAAMRLLKLLRLNGDTDELAERRAALAEKFALPVEEWSKWIDDEKAMGASAEEVESLFRRALADLPATTLWIEFILFACGSTPAKAREILEDAITALGMRVDVGGTVWNAYIDYEEALEEGSKEKQTARVAALFTRALRIPTQALKELHERYTEFAGDSVDTSIIDSFKSSAKVLNELEKLEDLLEQNDHSVDAYWQYLEWEKNKGEPTRVVSFYERILEKHSLNDNVWLDYTTYLTEHLKVPSATLSVYKRAVRYCPSSCPLWQSLLLALEKAGALKEEIASQWSKAKENIASADDGRALYRTYAFVLKRVMDARGEKSYEEVGTVLDEGAQVLPEYFGKMWDPQSEYRRMQAFFHYDKLKDAKKGHAIFEDVLASGSGRYADKWLEAIKYERFYGSTANVRAMFYKAVNSVSDHPQQVFVAFVQFEREEGTIEQLEKALAKVNSQQARRMEEAEKQAAKGAKEVKKGKGGAVSVAGGKRGGGMEGTAHEHRGGHGQAHGKQQQRTAQSGKSATVMGNGAGKGVKRPGATPPALATPEKRPKSEEKLFDKDGFVVPNAPAPKSPRSGTASPRSPSGSAAVGSPASPSTSTAAPFASFSQAADTGKTEKNEEGDKKWTVFVSNLDFKATEEQIKEVLSGVVEVRLLFRGMSKLHKGYGYVDLEDERAFRKALASDRVQIQGRPMYVSENKPEKDTRTAEGAAFKYAKGLERNKLFVKGVHYDATAEQLQEVFSSFGPVSDVRIVTHKSGKAKGVAYVDMQREEDAAKAVQATDVVLLDRKLSVFLSNPPKKGETAPGQFSARFSQAPPVGGRIGHSSKIDFLPRGIATKTKTETAGAVETTQGKPAAAVEGRKGNDYFSSLFKK